jgi:hypothetical protein
LLIEPVRSIYRFDRAALEYIIDVSDGRPFRIQQYALEAVNHMLGKRGRRITLDDVRAVQGRIEASHDGIGTPPNPDLNGNSVDRSVYASLDTTVEVTNDTSKTPS